MPEASPSPAARLRASLIALPLLVSLACGTPQDTAEPSQPTPDSPAISFTPHGVELLALSHILVAYEGARNSDSSRSREEAGELATELARRARAGESFEDLAREYSDDHSAARGGSLGVKASNRLPSELSAACLALEIGGVGDPVETAYGFHVLRRDPVVQIGLRHIFVGHEEGQVPNPSRTRREARELAERLFLELLDGADFATLAREHSDGPRAARGGDMGGIYRGVLTHDALEAAAFSLDVGGISDVVETPAGYHIFQRYR